MDLLESFENSNPEQLVIERENTRAIQERLKKDLSKLERQVVQLYLQGLNYRQIAQLLEKSPKAIDNALQRIRGKIRGLNVSFHSKFDGEHGLDCRTGNVYG